MINLIRRPEGYYVPKYYDYWDENKDTPMWEYLKEDYKISPPSYCFDTVVNKWRLDFAVEDPIVLGETRKLSYFFNSEWDLLNFLRSGYTPFVNHQWE